MRTVLVDDILWIKATPKGRTWHAVEGSSGYTACGIRLPTGPVSQGKPGGHICKKCAKAMAG